MREMHLLITRRRNEDKKKNSGLESGGINLLNVNKEERFTKIKFYDSKTGKTSEIQMKLRNNGTRKSRDFRILKNFRKPFTQANQPNPSLSPVSFSPISLIQSKGIINPSLDCFIISSLQCLFSIHQFEQHFLNAKNSTRPVGNQLKLLLQRMKNYAEVELKDFRNLFTEDFPKHKQHDATGVGVYTFY